MTTIAAIQQAVSQRYGIDPAVMQQDLRARAITRKRDVAQFLARKLTRRSFPIIARHFGGRDHSSVIAACRRLEARMVAEPELACEVAAIERQLQPEEIST